MSPTFQLNTSEKSYNDAKPRSSTRTTRKSKTSQTNSTLKGPAGGDSTPWISTEVQANSRVSQSTLSNLQPSSLWFPFFTSWTKTTFPTVTHRWVNMKLSKFNVGDIIWKSMKSTQSILWFPWKRRQGNTVHVYWFKCFVFSILTCFGEQS